MTQIELFGFIAALLTSMAYLPQAVMIIRTGVTTGISLLMYSMLTSGKILWLSYGVLVTSWPLILSQTFTLCLASIILSLTFRNSYKAKKNRTGQERFA
ncbi:SemiSWEET transporter [Hellea balneolensis]|uniref:SemiSWEET transporter n=1 Tax=Hellea balneolensis TaxID=287478 RepID=UPI00041285B6|nr:SemiSWEET transporter [Hellea balneolensis]